MKEAQMLNDWRTVQLFLEENGVFEVQIDSINKTLVRCSCRGAKPQTKCAHAKFVRENMLENDGHYAVHIPVEVDEDEAMEAMDNAESFRNFIIKYGKVEVI